MKEYKSGAAGGPGADAPETEASKPGPAGGQGGSLWRQALWAERMAGAKALRQDCMRTSPGGSPAGLSRQLGTGRAGPDEASLQTTQGLCSCLQGGREPGTTRAQQGCDAQWQQPAGCWGRLGWGRVGTGRPGPGRRWRPRAPCFSSRAGSSGLAPSLPPSCTPAQASARSESPASAPPGKGPA